MTAPRMINANALRSAIGFENLIEPMAAAFRQSSAGEAQNGLVVMFPDDRIEDGDVYVKTGVLRGRNVYIVKIAPWFADNASAGRPQGGFVAVFDSSTGHTRAILSDEHYLSDIRTAAAGALAARLFAQPRVDTAAVLGTGVQAELQCLALHHERPFRRLLVWGRDSAKALAVIERLRARLPHITFETAESVEAAVAAADVLITATLAREPIVQGSWLRPGQLIVAVGADDPTKCELDATALLRSRVFVDSRETAVVNGCVRRAVDEGHPLDALVTAEIGDVVSGAVMARLDPNDIVVVKLVGIGAQDVVTAEIALRRLDEQCANGLQPI